MSALTASQQAVIFFAAFAILVALATYNAMARKFDVSLYHSAFALFVFVFFWNALAAS